DGAKVYIKDGKLFSEIKGVKVGKDRGQEKRIVGVELDSNNIAHRMFKAFLDANNNEMTLKMNGADYSSIKKFFHRNYKDISLYTFRHKMGADLKGGGYNKVEIAKILGHRNTRSQSYYGYSHHHSKIGGLDVEASNDVKVVNNFKDGIDKKARQNDFSNRLKKVKGGFSNPNIISRPKFTPPGKK
ncbi:hypothetical protein, partial [Klebsiella pneumoniae]|uniref:hypothetical protein n=2 Tax=Klebsiella pneumoniae TaxID=573 RepID=UPI001C8C96AB